MIPSMLHFIVNLVENKNPDVLEFHKDIAHVEHAARGTSFLILIATNL